MSMSLYPWQQTQWQRIQQYYQQQRMPHALLLTGAKGLGKYEFAENLAKSLLCLQRQSDSHACGVCRSCELWTAKTHPDFLIRQPEEAGQAIKIDSIRGLSDWACKTRHQGHYKVVLIEPGEAMNLAAANCLLKTLEEPADGLVIILVSHHSMLLPATIRSRCQWLKFTAADAEMLTTWLATQLPDMDLPSINDLLQQSYGSPLQAMALADTNLQKQQQKLLQALTQNLNPVELAATHLQLDLTLLLNWLLHWTVLLIQINVGANQVSVNAVIQAFAVRCVTYRLFAYLDKLYEVRRQLSQKANLNQQLLVEDLFCRWAELTAK